MTESPPEREESTGRDNQQNSALIPLVFASVFICMGCLTERCLWGNLKDRCPLLPAVLVFLEWLVAEHDRVKGYNADERVVNALFGFFVADLLDRSK